ncbi:MAG: VCBS repeat-containing protein, partial [Bacteroidota bacterium]
GDVDGDGDQDLVWGDFFNRSLYFLRNTGTPTSPQLVLSDSTWPKETPVLTDGFNMPQLVDLNNDERIDLLVGVLYPSYSVDNFMYYRNDGTQDDHQFVLETMNLIPTLDVGSTSSPAFVDVDGDGDLDLIVGSEDGKLAWFERTGLAGQAAFMHKTDRFVDLTGLFNISPAFGDLDGDGKPDLLAGDANGRLRLYKGTTNFPEDTTFALRTVSFGQNAAPVLVDIDNNGTLDLFVGTGGGRIHYFRNTGSAMNPAFALQTAFFDSIDIGDDAKPVFVDLDNDGDQDLVVGARDGSVNYWRNDGTPMSFSFTFVKDFFLGINAGARAAPAFADLDGDGDHDLFLGNTKGGLYFYYNDRIVSGVEQDAGPVSFT